MSHLTGTGALVRLILRRDRVRIAVWIVAITALVVVTASSVKGLYPTQADLDAAASVVEGNAAVIALNGPAIGLDTLGGRVVFEVGSFGFVVVGLMSLLMIGRHTRAEEESGRTELVRATVVGRHAPTAAALLVVAGMSVAVGALVALALVGQGLPARGSLVLGAAFAVFGVVMAGVATVAAQVTENTRVVYGSAGAVLGVAFVLRAVGDIGDGTASWLSPMGWVQASRPFAGDRPWPLLLAVVVAAALVLVAGALTSRRDVGAGLVPPRPGPANASRRLAGPFGLAFRLQRGSLIGWTAGLFLSGLSYGSVGQDVEDLVGDNEALADLIASTGAGSLTDAFFGTAVLMLALIGSGYAIQSAQRLGTEEIAVRAEPVLATPVSRRRWAAGSLAVALAGSVLVIGAAGLGTGLAFGLVSGNLAEVPRMVGAALLYVPAVWVLVGLAAALFGLGARLVLVAWAGLAACVVIGLVGGLLDLPGWLIGLSPFQYTPQLPAEDLAVVPPFVLTAVAAALVGAGVAAFARRDVGRT